MDKPLRCTVCGFYVQGDEEEDFVYRNPEKKEYPLCSKACARVFYSEDLITNSILEFQDHLCGEVFRIANCLENKEEAKRIP